jgi:hypothetical protein
MSRVRAIYSKNDKHNDEIVDSDDLDSSDENESYTEESYTEESYTEESYEENENIDEPLSYIHEKHGLLPTLSEYINNKVDIDNLIVYLCIFYSDTTIPSRSFVKYIVKKDDQTVSFPNFIFKIVFDTNSNINNEIDETLEKMFQHECRSNIGRCFRSTQMSPKITFRGIIPDENQVFAFFEIEDSYQLENNHLNGVIDELVFLNTIENQKISKHISDLFGNNQKLKYYYDENDAPIPPPKMGYAISNKMVFNEPGKYFSVKGSGQRFVFFVENPLFLLDNNKIAEFNANINTPEMIIRDQDSVFFREDDDEFWFLSDDIMVSKI